MFPSINPPVGNECAGGGPRTTNNVPIRDSSNRYSSFFHCFLPFTRFWGVFTAIVLCGVGVDLAFHKHNSGYYLIGSSAAVLFLEVTWVVTLFLQLCVRAESRVFRCWSVFSWLEGWKKSLLYAPLGAVPLICPHKLWLSYVAAGQLVALAFFHFVLSFKGRRRRKRKDRLLHADIDSFESSKFEEVTEVLDDGLPEPIPGSSHSLSDSLAEQDTILEI
ncbi:uncharacterized protein LOC103315080 isoform X1 [Tribolium castaneum]|uniref:uncharacterized protein LOC103315080 isoform X1 n=1 Tax=Tribolium castaneum TaxID=7070 RepID=UPI0030FF05DC